MKRKHWKCVGPIVLSALSLFLSFLIIQPLALFLNPTWNLLASRGIGKVAFVSMAIYQIVLLLFFLKISNNKMIPSAGGLQKNFFSQFLNRNLLFIFKEKWFLSFSSFFIVFFSFHASILLLLYKLHYLTYQSNWGIFNPLLIGKTIFGLFVVFMLAWTEELIFRGTIYPYLAHYYPTLPSMVITSFIFMFVHNLKNPLTLITAEWQLGLGLFLLGFLLNQIFVITQKLYTGMGLHAGLVFVKVILRRAPFLTFIPQNQWAWWLHKDLRQSPLVHFLFIVTILLIFLKYKDKFFTKNQSFK